MTRRQDFLLLLACFVLSGTAGLIYETAWTQQFALVFGTSELAVATVLAAYMAGLTAGAAIAGRRVARVRRPVLVYALLELGIALAALAVPFALRGAARLQVAVLGGLDVPAEAGSLSSASFYLVAAFAILMVPTAMMGATLPLLTRHAVRTDAEIGRRVGLLYSANTAGAAAGTLLAAFVLLPWLGLGRTVLAATAINGLVFLLAVTLARRNRAPMPAPGPSAESTAPDRSSGRAVFILPLILVSGIVSFSWEVLWTRLLSHLVGGSIYAFGTMLATFLAGIGLGSAVAARLAVDRERARHGFAVAQLGIAAASLAAFAAVDRLPRVIADLELESFAYLPPGAWLAAAVLLPRALLPAATLPSAVRALAGSAAGAGPASARVFAWNTCGSIAGAVGTGFVLLPSLRIAGTATAAVVTSLALAAATALLARPRHGKLALAAALGLAAVAVLPPATPWEVLRTSPLSGKRTRGEVAFYGVGRGSTVTLFESYDQWRLFTNGLPESAIQSRGGRPARFWGARALALLPLVGQPAARSYLIVGLGAGITVDAVPATVDEIHVVELEPEVVRANRSLAGERERDPLADPRLRLHVNDARSALALTERRFDAVISQPSHPWTAGASHLFTRELFELVRGRLNPGGVFVQWMGLAFVDEDLLRSLVATLLDVFPHVEVHQPRQSGPLLFLARVEPLAIEETAALALAADREEWLKIGVRTPEDILLSRLLDTAGARRFAAGADDAGVAPTAPPRITDSRNLLRTRSPRVLGSALGQKKARQLFADFDPLIGRADEPGSGDRSLYYVRQLVRLKDIGRARRLAAAITDPARRQVAFGLLHLAAGRRVQGERNLRRALDAAPSSAATSTSASWPPRSEAFYALLSLHRSELVSGHVPASLAARMETDPEARAVVEAWRLAELRHPAAVRELEPRLAEIDPRHPLATAATILRIGWRQALGDPRLAREALELLEPELANGSEGPWGLIRRARLALLAHDRAVASASLAELAGRLGNASERLRRDDPKPKPAASEAALRVLETFPDAWKDTRYARLHADLSKPPEPRPPVVVPDQGS